MEACKRKLAKNIFRLSRSYSSKASKGRYDAVVIGGGHNGLVSAAYLARSGKSVCVLERRDIVGGAAVTEEIIPGYKFSRCSYVLSLLRPQIFRDLDLKKHGLQVYLRDPSSYTPLKPEFFREGAKSLTLYGDPAKTREEIAKFSTRDAEMYEKYEHELNQFVDIIDPLLDVAPSEITSLLDAPLLQKLLMLRNMKPVTTALKSAGQADISALYELIMSPSSKVLSKWFESEPLKATLATDACIGAMGGPSTPGGGYVLLHHVMGELEGKRGAWGYPRGGMGAVSGAIAKSAVESGVEIVTGAKVKSINVENGNATGVCLEDGTVLEAKTVLSNATPRITYNELLSSSDVDPDYLSSVNHIDYTSPVTKINVAVNKLPNFSADPNKNPDEAMPHHQATIHLNCENCQILEDAFKDGSAGRVSSKPMIEMTIPSSLDDSLAPEGHHVCLFFTQYTPYNMEWNDGQKEAYAKVVFDTVEEYAPGFKASIVGKEVLTPKDLEREFGLTGGNIFHGSMSLDQLFLTRPVADRKRASPGSPISGLYLCGSGAHPGGGVMGAPGRLAAKTVVKDLGGEVEF